MTRSESESDSDSLPRRRARAVPEPLDRDVLVRCQAQDPMAFRAFVVRYERMVFALLSRVLGPSSEVEDLAQEAFVRAYRAFPTWDLDGPAKVSTWLVTIATRLALDSRKRRPVATESLDAPAALAVATGSSPDVTAQRRELGRALAEAARRLPDDQRAALVLGELHGLSIAEIAAALDVPEATAKTKLFRAREKMRALLGPEWIAERRQR